MAVKYGRFEMPQEAILDKDSATSTYGRFVVKPFERGFGHTIGNTMRRTMLASLEAPAIITVRIEDVPHEYMAIDGVTEDMTNIILNLKGALLRKLPSDTEQDSRQPRILTKLLEVTDKDLKKHGGEYAVTLGDIVQDGFFEVVNPDLQIFTVTKPFKRQVDLRIAIGRGYVPSERHEVNDRIIDEILLDAAFSPVRLVNYFIENTRVGQDTDLDQLILEVETDGRVTPSEAVSFSAQIAAMHLGVFEKIESLKLTFDEGEEEGLAPEDEMMAKLALRIDEIELSVRSTNCLSGANIDTIAELVCIPERRMLEFRNFGKKSLNEIKAKLTDMGLHLGMELGRYGITEDNVRQKLREYQEKKTAELANNLEG